MEFHLRDDSGSESDNSDENAPLVQPNVASSRPATVSRATGLQLTAIWCTLLYLLWDALQPTIGGVATHERLFAPETPLDAPAPRVRLPTTQGGKAPIVPQPAAPSASTARPAAVHPPSPSTAAVPTIPVNTTSAACPAAWTGDGVCQLTCAAAAHGDRGDCRAPSAECDKQVGLGYLTSVRHAREAVCTGGRSRAWLHNVADQGCRCDTCRTKLTVLEGARIAWDPAGGAEPAKKRAQGVHQPCLSARLACTDPSKDLARLTPSDRGYGLAIHADGDAGPPCSGDGSIKETALLVVNPRGEFLSNVWHAVVEVAALMHTAHVVGEELSAMRLIFVQTHRNKPHLSPTVLQMGGRRTHGDAAEWRGSRPQLIELFEKVMGGTRELAPWKGPATPSCFAKVVLPLRSCQGAVLSRDARDVCGSGGNPLASAYAHAVLRAFALPLTAVRQAGVPPRVTILTRADTATGAGARGKGRGKGRGRGRNRVLQEPQKLVAALEGACAAKVSAVGLASLSFAQQLELMQRTDVLVGPHGAGLTHILHLPPHAAVVELTNTPPPQPGRSVANIYRSIATWTNHPYRSVRGAEKPDPQAVAKAACQLLAGAGAGAEAGGRAAESTRVASRGSR